MEAANDLLHAAMLVASAHRGAPVVVGGDFNFSKSDLSVLQRVLESSTWSDALAAFSHHGPCGNRVSGSVHTHFSSHMSWATRSGGPKLHRFLGNNAAKRLLSGAWATTTRVPGSHLPISLRFDATPSR